MNYIIHVFALFVVVAFSAGQSFADEDAVTVREAWLRAPVMAGRPAAGYFTVDNAGTEELVITGARTTAATRIELHQHVMKGGTMMMRRVETVTVPAGGTVRFEPHGYHLMVFGLGEPAPGSSIMITLDFADHPPVTVEAGIVATGAGSPYHKH